MLQTDESIRDPLSAARLPITGLKSPEWLPMLWISVIIIATLTCIIIWSVGFDPIDDHRLLTTLASGHFLWSPDMSHGRFEPLNGVLYNSLLLLFDRVRPFYLHSWNGVEFLILCLISTRLLKRQVIPTLASLGVIIFIIQPAYITAINRIFVSERLATLALVSMLFFYNSYSRNRRAVRLIACVASANIAIYSKEPIAGAITVFALSELILGQSMGDESSATDRRTINYLLLLSGMVFFPFYLVSALGNHDASYATARRFLPWFPNLFQNIRGYSLFSDPFNFFVSIPLGVARLATVAKNRKHSNGWTDSALFAGISYTGAILILNMSYTSYYLLPAAALVVPAVIRFCKNLQGSFTIKSYAISVLAVIVLCATPSQIAGSLLVPITIMGIAWGILSSKSWVKPFAIGLAGSVFVLNSLPGSINQLALLKSRPVAYEQLITLVANHLHLSGDSRRRIFISGMNASSGIEAYISIDRNLRYRGFNTRTFDLVSSTPPGGPVSIDIDSPITVYREPSAKEPLKGDLLIFSPGEPPKQRLTTIQELACTKSLVTATLAVSLDQVIALTKERLFGRRHPGIIQENGPYCIDVVP